MKEYSFREIEQKWQEAWEKSGIYQVTEDPSRPKFYVLDMFPYPSGSGLHVGHPLGYIASDIYSRFKRQKGFNVLHPMGFDAFGLPAEQYAIDHGVHPADSTTKNIAYYKQQLKHIGFCYDWSREVQTCDPAYYRWTQWIFMQMFNSWYNRQKDQAQPIEQLVSIFEREGNQYHPAPADESLQFSAAEWKSYCERERLDILMQYRLAYLDYAEVWWCEALGTVLANDEVVNGVSERGGHPVERKRMRQWFLRITEYAERLLLGLEEVQFSESLKEMQRNWIGKSYGAEVEFELKGLTERLKVYTTRPDTLFGVDFMVVAPEHELLESLTSEEQKPEMEAYLAYVKSRSERDRMSEVNKITGCFTGSYAIHPFTGRELPVWTAEYVLAGYGTGAIMAVPCGDERDFAFAKYFGISITNILGAAFDGTAANPDKSLRLENSDFLNGLDAQSAINRAIERLESLGLGKRKTNYRLRDAGFSRQRYWGEPFPVVYRNGIAELLPESELPVELPHTTDFSAGPEGQGPLANLNDWVQLPDGLFRETNTMPGYAGSSWYFLRYMDPHNSEAFCDRGKSDYWGQVDVYIGGAEHAVGHLLYSRMWTKVLFDLGHIGFEEPYKKLINQGKIGGDSRLVYRIRGTQTFVSSGLKDAYETDELHVDISLVNGIELDTEALKQWRPDFASAEFILEDGKYLCGSRQEKMGKRYFNVVNPDDVIRDYGADTLRLYEMFLGPLEDSKPWSIQGIDGVYRFLRKVWRLYVDEEGQFRGNEAPASNSALKSIHKCLKKVSEDMERFSFNTCVSSFMICCNELSADQCRNAEVLRLLNIILAPFAPHLAEELWQISGQSGTVLDAPWPAWEERYLVENTKEYPVSINGKVRTNLVFALDKPVSEIEAEVMQNEVVQKWLEGKSPKKMIVVPGRIINIVM